MELGNTKDGQVKAAGPCSAYSSKLQNSPMAYWHVAVLCRGVKQVPSISRLQRSLACIKGDASLKHSMTWKETDILQLSMSHAQSICHGSVHLFHDWGHQHHAVCSQNQHTLP